jgi:hypothetical protein
MESIIELQRQEHEEMERYEQALADILNKPVTGVSCLCNPLGDSLLNLLCTAATRRLEESTQGA